MTLEVMQDIAEALDELFPINTFLINEKGIISWVNKGMLELSGMTKLESIQGKHVAIFGEKEWITSKQVIDSKRRKILYEHYDHKDFFVIKAPYKKKRFMGMIGLSIDISKLKQAERAKSIFTMNIGHDTRTPFCGIVTVLELLYAKENNKENKDLLEMSLYSSKRLLDFMNDIQEVSQLGHLPFDEELCDIKAMVADIILFLMPATEMKRLEIEASCTGDEIMINRYRIEKILLNLLGNAVKFTEQGTITVSIKTSPILTIVVSDTGIGIDEKHHEKIFEDFFKVVASYKKNEYAGIGKGLYLVKRYTEELQGSVSLQSALGKGSVFTVTIPVKR